MKAVVSGYSENESFVKKRHDILWNLYLSETATV